jgi:mono/diheme cytochrome c family protein
MGSALAIPMQAADAGAGATPAQSLYAARVQPIFERSCVACHGPEKKKGRLRLDSFAAVMQGGAGGAVIAPGAPEKSELYRRILLPAEDDEAMPAEGKPRLTAPQIAVIEAWIRAGASPDAPVGEFAALAAATEAPAPAAPDYRPFRAQLTELERALSVRLVPISENPTDGIILRTASAPQRLDDAAVERLKPIAPLIVDAELARTQITDNGLVALAGFANLRHLDLAYTRVTSAGVARLTPLVKLQTLNLVATKVDASARVALRGLPALRAVYDYGAHSGAAQ